MLASIRLAPEEAGKAPYVWLPYLLFLFLGPALARDTGAAWEAAASIAVFFPIYLRGFCQRGGRAALVLAAIVAIGVWMAPRNTGASTFFIFAAGFVQQLGTPKRAFAGLMSIAVVFTVTVLSMPADPVLILVGGVGVLSVGGSAIHLSAMEEKNAHLQLAHDEIAALARANERDRISGDLHDLLGHSLTVIALKAEVARRVRDADPARAERELADLESLAREALADVRVAVLGYRGQRGASLAAELTGAERALEAAGIPLELTAGPAQLEDAADAQDEGVLALALREAVTNVIRHAEADQCTVEFFREPDGFGVRVGDDGHGRVGVDGNGIRVMRARLEALGGTLTRTGGDGSVLCAWLPRHPALEASA